jgi:hypothetical protein
MEARYRLWICRLVGLLPGLTALTALVFVAILATPLRAALPDTLSATATPAAATPTPAPPACSRVAPLATASPAAGLSASLAPMIDLRTTGGAVPAEPFAFLISGAPHKQPLVPVRKSTCVAPNLPAQPFEQVESADADLAADAKRQATLIIENQTDVEICYVYISPSDSDSWGEDWLGNETIPPGEERQIRLPPGEYDLKATDCDGEVLDDQRSVELSGVMRWTIAGMAEPTEDQDRDTYEDEAEGDDESSGADDDYPARPEDAQPPPLTQFLCCGYTVGGTRIWGISYPEGWQVRYLPNGNPNDFVGAIFASPDDNIEIVYIPSAWTPMGTPMDVGDVDQYLNAYTAHRAQQDPGFREFLREPVAGFPMYRVWSGTWERDGNQYYESFLIGVNAMPYVEGMARGTINAMGARSEASQWHLAKAIYNAMLATAQIQVIGPGGYTPPAPGPSDDPEEQSVAESGGSATSFWETVFCPVACHWETIDINNQPAGRIWCCSDNCVGSLSRTPCGRDQCQTGCADY